MLGKLKDFINNYIKKVVAEQKTAEAAAKKETPKRPQRDFGADISSMELSAAKMTELLKLSFQKGINDFVVKDTANGVAMDSSASIKDFARPAIDMSGTTKDIVYTFFSKFGFIGWQNCAILAQHWLISNACSLPAKDAIRNGWINTFADADKKEATGEEKEKEQKFLNELNEITNTKYALTAKAIEWITKYNIYGIGIALPKIDGIDYTKPYNPDGIKKGSFKGISIIEPYWLTPQFDEEVMTDPTHPNFYKPTHYLTASGEKIHISHLIVIRRKEVPDILKPSYYFGGIPLTQEIFERVYAAEKSANEQPLLLLTKRLNGWKIDLNEFFLNPEKYRERIQNFTETRDNQGVLLVDHEDDMFQIDTALSDLDQVVMSQYKLVAAVARIPVDKLFELNPSGTLSNSGDFNIKNYTQDLNTIQNDLYKPFIDRINEIVMRSYYDKKDKIAIIFNPTDNPTAQEQATNVKTEVDTLQALIGNNVITTEEARQKLIADKRNGFSFLDEEAPEQEEDNEEIVQMMKEHQNKQQQSKAEDEEEPEYWFSTKNGAHIPVYKGQTPKEAMKKVIENKKTETKKKNKLTAQNINFNRDGIIDKIKNDLKNFMPESSINTAMSLIEDYAYTIYSYPPDKIKEEINQEIELPEKFDSINDIVEVSNSVEERIKKIKQEKFDSWKKNNDYWLDELKTRIDIYNKVKQKRENPPKGENIDSEGNKIKNPEQFKKWFGNSKAVDSNGNPIVLYHGSKHQLEGGQFDFKHKGDSVNKQNAFFSTTREDVAQTYVRDDGKVHKVFLKMERPLIVDFKGENFRTGGFKQFEVTPYGESSNAYPTTIERKSRFADASEAPIISKIVNYAKKNGYDGVIAKNIDDYGGFIAKHSVPEYNDDYIVFNPKEQIKAVDNDGQWSGKTIYDEAIIAEDTDWITVHPHGNKEAKGQPVPVEEGQGKGEAIKQHFSRAAAGETGMYNDNDDDDFDDSFNPEVIEEQEELAQRNKEQQKSAKKEARQAKKEQTKWENMSEEEKDKERNEQYEAEQKREKQAKKETVQKTLPEAKKELEDMGIMGIRKPTKEGYGKERWSEYESLSPRIKRYFFDKSDSDYSLKWDEAEAILQQHKGDTADLFEYLREIDIKTPHSRTNERTRKYLEGSAEDDIEWLRITQDYNDNHDEKGRFARKTVSITEDEIKAIFGEYKDIEELREKAYKYYRDNIQGKTVDIGTYKNIRIARKSAERYKHYGADERKLLIVPKLREILETSKYKDSEDLYKKRDDNIVKFHYFTNKVILKGKPYEVYITIGEDNKGNLFYDLDENKKDLKE